MNVWVMHVSVVTCGLEERGRKRGREKCNNRHEQETENKMWLVLSNSDDSRGGSMASAILMRGRLETKLAHDCK